MKFEINILGCAAATPTVKRNPTSQLLNIHDKLFLIDCAEGTQLQLRKYKFKFQRITHIFISHLHGDHYLGLFGLMSSMHLLGRVKPLHIHGPKGLKEIIELNIKLSQSYLNYTYEFHENSDDDVHLIHEDKTLTIHSIPLKHRISTTGFLISEKPKKNRIKKNSISKYELSIEEILTLKRGEDVNRGKILITSEECTLPPLPPRKYAYMSDTAVSEDYIEHVRGVDLLYHESTFLNDKEDRAKVTFHSTAAQAAKFASKAQVHKLCLGHYSNRYTDIREFLTEAKPHFENVILANDGLSIRVE